MTDSVLLFRNGGALWGVGSEAVERVVPAAGRLALCAGAATLAADEVVGVVPALAVRPLPAALRRFWSPAARGVAVHAGEPVVLVDSARPPTALMVELEPTDSATPRGDGADVREP